MEKLNNFLTKAIAILGIAITIKEVLEKVKSSLDEAETNKSVNSTASDGGDISANSEAYPTNEGKQ